jgi:DNA (cytosine-5)-methyltransferase 1
MIYGSVCSGIEAATHAWHPLGWKASFFSEIEDFPRKVLAHHYPNTPLHGDFTTIMENDYEPIKLLVGGTPCQSFSIAGLRAGLDDPRGNLMLEFGALAKRLHPKWLVWENVPGVLSSNGGKDFATFLAMLGELGYGFAYRVLDAQHFGVPQRRRRVFVIGCLGDFGSAAAVLFERNSLQGDTTQSKGKGKETAPTLTRGFGDCGLDLDQIAGGAYEIRTGSGKDKFGTLMANCGTKQWLGNQEALSGDYHILQPISLAGNTIGRQPENGGNGNGYDESGVSYTLTKTDVHAVAHAFKVRGGCEGGGKGYLGSDEQAFTLSTGADQQLFHKMQVRRLMPIECERLQGFRDGFTNIPGASDSARYKALGNSMAVPVMKWLGERIDMVEKIQKELK